MRKTRPAQRLCIDGKVVIGAAVQRAFAAPITTFALRECGARVNFLGAQARPDFVSPELDEIGNVGGIVHNVANYSTSTLNN